MRYLVGGDPVYGEELLADDDVFRDMLEAFDIVGIATVSRDLDDGLDGLFTLFWGEIEFSGVRVEGVNIDKPDEESSTAVITAEAEGAIVIDGGIRFDPPAVIEEDELVYDFLGSFTCFDQRVGDGDGAECFDIGYGL